MAEAYIIDACRTPRGMNEYPIAQMDKDVRVKQIYGRTTEIMKLLIARTLEA